MRHALRSLAVFAFILSCCLGRCLAAHSGASPSSLDQSPASAPLPAPALSPETVLIPGPLRSFLRMAGISQQVPNQDVLPMLQPWARHFGYEA